MVHRSQAELDEERALVTAAQRERSAFAPLYERYVDQIHSYVLGMTRDGDMAEEITAATFARAIEELPRFEWRGVPYSAWLYRVAANLVHRSRRRRPPVELHLDHADPTPGPEDLALRADRAAEVRSAVALLPDDQRQAILLRFGGQLRNKEIAEVMGRSEGAVKLLTFRALTALRRRLGAPLPAEREGGRGATADAPPPQVPTRTSEAAAGAPAEEHEIEHLALAAGALS